MVNQGLGWINFWLWTFGGQHLLSQRIIRLCKTERESVYLRSWCSALVKTNLEEILRNQWIVLSGLRSLRITSKDGGPCNEYRIQDHSVEFRAVDEQRTALLPFVHMARLGWRRDQASFCLADPSSRVAG